MGISAQLGMFTSGRAGWARNLLCVFDVSLVHENTKPKVLLEVVREVIRLRHVSYKIEGLLGQCP